MVDIRLAPLQRALLLAAALAAAAPVAADPPAAYGARRAAEITFRDWRLACLGDDCAIRTVLKGADGSAVLALEARRAGEGGELAVATPLPLFLPDGLALALGDAPPREAPWRTCDRDGCSALLPVDGDLLAALKRERTADVGLTLVEGVRVRLSASLLGFTAAWQALPPPKPPAAAPSPRPAPQPAPEPEPEPAPEAEGVTPP